jgi:hypothetical protein
MHFAMRSMWDACGPTYQSKSFACARSIESSAATHDAQASVSPNDDSATKVNVLRVLPQTQAPSICGPFHVQQPRAAFYHQQSGSRRL